MHFQARLPTEYSLPSLFLVGMADIQNTIYLSSNVNN